ncbi:SDR family oxidoreductase [Amycolatopsis sp. NPDC005003]
MSPRAEPSFAGTGLTGLVGSRVRELTPELGWWPLGCDITDAAAVDRATGDCAAGTIVHFAAFTDTAAAWRQRGDLGGPCYRVNVLGTRNVAAACRRHGRYLVHVSTDYVFDGTKDSSYTEEDAVNPRDWYGRTKAWAEEEVRSAGGEHLILRPSFPFRAAFPAKEDLVRRLLRGLAEGSVGPLFTDTLITPTFIDDLASAFRSIAARRPTGILHAAGSTALSPHALGERVAEAFGLTGMPLPGGKLADHVTPGDRPYARNLSVSNARARRVLGVRFATIDEALHRMRAQRPAAHTT